MPMGVFHEWKVLHAPVCPICTEQCYPDPKRDDWVCGTCGWHTPMVFQHDASYDVVGGEGGGA